MTLEEARALMVNNQRLGSFSVAELRNALVWAQVKLQGNPESPALLRIADACRVLIADAEKDQTALDLGDTTPRRRSPQEMGL